MKALTRCKAGSLTTPVGKSEHYYVYDTMELGLDLLKKMSVTEGTITAKTARASI